MRRNTLLTGIGAASLAALAVGRRRRALQAVAPELRHRGLWVPKPITNRAELMATRTLRRWQEGPGPGTVFDRLVATPENDQHLPPVDLLRIDPPTGTDAPVDTRFRAGTTGAVLWIHGGGLLVGSPERTAPFGAELAAALGVPVFLNRYRLAPEHPYPAAIDDCLTALQWLHVHADALGIDPDRIVVGGHSAGGGLAAVLCQRALDCGIPVAQQTLVYPMLDERTGFPGHTGDRPRVDQPRVDQPHVVQPGAGRGLVGWDAASNRYGWSSYLGHQPTVADRRYAAARRRKDLTGLPPAWIGVGELDLFLDEDVAYADRLRDAGVATELVVVPGMYHAAEREVPDAPSMIEFTHSMQQAIRRAVTD